MIMQFENIIPNIFIIIYITFIYIIFLFILSRRLPLGNKLNYDNKGAEMFSLSKRRSYFQFEWMNQNFIKVGQYSY